MTEIAPHSIEAEQAVLGAIFLRPEVLGRVAEIIAPTDFYRTAHRTIYEAMQRVGTTGADIDWVGVGHDLESRGLLAEVGGRDALIAITESMVTSAGVAEWAAIVRDKALRRRIIVATNRVMALAKDPVRPTADLIDEIGATIRDLHNSPIHTHRHGVAHAESEAALLEAGDTSRHWLTGHPSIDRFTLGYQPDSIHTLCGETGAGKTYMAWHLLASFARANSLPVGMVTLEMSAAELIERQVVGDSEYAAVRSGRTADMRAIGGRIMAHRETEMHIASPGSSPAEVMDAIRALAWRGCRMIAIDYIQLIACGSRDLAASAGEMIGDLKSLGRRLGVCLLLLSQLNRPTSTVKGVKRRSPFSFGTDDTYGHHGAHAGKASHTVSVVVRPSKLAQVDDLCGKIDSEVRQRFGDVSADSLTIQHFAKVRRGTAPVVAWYAGSDGNLIPVPRDLRAVVVGKLRHGTDA